MWKLVKANVHLLSDFFPPLCIEGLDCVLPSHTQSTLNFFFIFVQCLWVPVLKYEETDLWRLLGTTN